MDKFDNPLLFVCLTDLAQFQPVEIFCKPNKILEKDGMIKKRLTG